MLRETTARPSPGILMAGLLVLGVAAGAAIFVFGAREKNMPQLFTGLGVLTIALLCLPGLFTVAPNEGKVLTLNEPAVLAEARKLAADVRQAVAK